MAGTSTGHYFSPEEYENKIIDGSGMGQKKRHYSAESIHLHHGRPVEIQAGKC
jgi:hypothetical protein